MSNRPLHQRFAQLAEKLPHVALAKLPTPTTLLDLNGTPLLAKLDGETSALYGGNKVRKLEYLLAQAQSHGCTRVATFGAAGSNHATATAVHAHAQGLRCTTFLSRQRATPWIADNLWRQLNVDTDIVYVDGARAQREHQAREWIKKCDERVWRIPMGGSSLAGALGYVNAGLEFAHQLENSALPDRLYVPLGTMGTAVGLAIGLKLAGLPIPLHAIRVVHKTIGSAALAPRFFDCISRLLTTLAPSIPRLTFNATEFVVREEFFGAGYAQATDGAIAAVMLAREKWGLPLETTYSGKTLAAVLADQRCVDAPKRPALWCTYSGHQTEPKRPADQLARLPQSLHPYI
ncbi:MAG: 1-aminocyclopropane-1-carboxylate deaminase/D-cysteine desulfhydrase [Gammaproteobacteria bacterium]